jgi:hypothetical protein
LRPEGFDAVPEIDTTERVYVIREAGGCRCGNWICERLKFLWGNAEHKTLTIVKDK